MQLWSAIATLSNSNPCNPNCGVSWIPQSSSEATSCWLPITKSGVTWETRVGGRVGKCSGEWRGGVVRGVQEAQGGLGEYMKETQQELGRLCEKHSKEKQSEAQKGCIRGAMKLREDVWGRHVWGLERVNRLGRLTPVTCDFPCQLPHWLSDSHELRTLQLIVNVSRLPSAKIAGNLTED